MMCKLFLYKAMASTAFQKFLSAKGIHLLHVCLVVDEFPGFSMRGGNILAVIMSIETFFNIRRVADIPLFVSLAFEEVNEIHSRLL